MFAHRKKLQLKEEDLRKCLLNSSSGGLSFPSVADHSTGMASCYSPIHTSRSSSVPTYTPQGDNFMAAASSVKAMNEREETYADDDEDALLAIEAEEFGWHNKEILSLDDLEEIDNRETQGAPSLPQQYTSLSPVTNRPTLSFGCAGNSSTPANQSIFKPPFLKSGNAAQKDSSFMGKFSLTSSGNKAPRDDSSEFRGQYQHTREMYKIFSQVSYERRKTLSFSGWHCWNCC